MTTSTHLPRGHALVAAAVALGLLAGACSSGGGTDTRAGASPDDATTTTSVAAPPGVDWPTATPEEVGLDPARLDDLAAYFEEENSYCMAVVKDGLLVDERYWRDTDADSDTEVFSASKSVSSTLVGIAQDQGLLDLDDPASMYITEWQGTPAAGITIRNLVSNDSGRYWDFQTDYLTMAAGAPDKTQFSIDLAQQHEPGTVWMYNNAAIQTLERVLEVATGEDVEDFAQEHLFGPLGMTSTIRRDAAGNPLTFMGTQAGCTDMARFGELFRLEGRWGDEQVVSEEWVTEATSPSQDLNAAYGYLWWLSAQEGWLGPVGGEPQTTPFWPDAPPDSFAALGLGNQITWVAPSEGLVVVRLGPGQSGEQGRVEVNEIASILLGDGPSLPGENPNGRGEGGTAGNPDASAPAG